MDSFAGSIVVGVDGSPSAQRALDWAAHQAEREHLPLSLVHTVGAVTPAWIDRAVADPAAAQDLLRTQAEELLDLSRGEVVRRAPAVEVRTAFRFEDPRETLLEASRTASMLVVGSHGRGRLRRLLLGSVGVALVRHAQCPVVVHRPGNPGRVRLGIAVGADGAPESRPVLEFAYRQASLHAQPLRVVHTYWDFQAATAEYVMPADPEESQHERLLLAEAMAGMAEKYPDVHAEVEVLRGRPEEALVTLADRMNLVVMGHHHGGRAAQLLFGSVAVAVVEHATCPVAVVPVAFG